MDESDSKRIIRQWDRDIEAELRREAAARKAEEGPWRAVTWIALWMLWLLVLVGLLTHVKGLR
jgi:hypothetical protein